jgi:mannosyltransferase OCH1-like enzyme
MSKTDNFNDQSRHSNPSKRDIHSIGGSLRIVSIPKNIMQYGNVVNSSRDAIMNHMSDWEYTFMTEDDAIDFIRDNFPYQLDTFLSLGNDEQKKNFITYMWLYIYGGCYIDSMFEPVTSISPLFYDEASLYFSTNPDNPGNVLTTFIASKPRCQFWLDLIDGIQKSKKPMWALGTYLSNRTTTGDEVLTKALHSSRDQYIIISPVILNPNGLCRTCRDTSKNKSDYYLKRVDGSLGSTMDEVIINTCKCYYDYIFYLIIGVIILLIGIYISVLLFTRNRGDFEDDDRIPSFHGTREYEMYTRTPFQRNVQPNMNTHNMMRSPYQGYPYIGMY